MKRNQKGFTIIEVGSVLLVVVVIGFGSYFVWHSQKSGKTSTASTSTKVAADPTAGWQAYTDTAKLFSLKYPSGWISTDSVIRADTPYALADKSQSIFTAPSTAQSDSPTEINVMAWSTTDIQGVAKSNSFGDKPTATQSMTINGYQALYWQDIETGSTGTNPTYTADYYAITHGGVTLIFSFREQQGNDSYLGTSSASGAFDHTNTVATFTLLVKSVKFLN